MIPPLQSLRLRSIKTYLEENQPSLYRGPSRSAALDARARELDEAMLLDFTRRADKLLDKRMDEDRWGTMEQAQQYRFEMIEEWNVVLATHLPPITDLSEDD